MTSDREQDREQDVTVEARDWAERTCTEMRVGVGVALGASGIPRMAHRTKIARAYNCRCHTLELAVAPLMSERDTVRAKYKLLCEAVNCGDLRCDDKPGNKCDSYGHDEDCPYVHDAITLMYQQGQLTEAWQLADALAEAVRAAEFSPDQKCPVCFGWDMSPRGETPLKHTKDCLTKSALTRYDAAKAKQ